MSRRVQGFGYIPDLRDPRDLIYGLKEPIKSESEVPPTGGRTPDTLPPIWDQGQIGSCTAHGTIRAYLAEAIQQGLSLPMLSRLMQYWDSRSLEGTTRSDSGAMVRDASTALAKYGCAPEDLWPYDTAKFAKKPPAKAYAAAKQHMAIQYKKIVVGSTGAPMRTALSRGQVIAFGFPVPDFFEDPSVWDPSSGEPLPLPGPSTGYIGGHCVALTFYNYSGKFISTRTTSRKVRPFFTADNSWNTDWGMGGRFNIDAEWFNPQRQLADDLWTFLKVG